MAGAAVGKGTGGLHERLLACHNPNITAPRHKEYGAILRSSL